MSVSAVTICSNALLDVGAQTISSFEEDGDRVTIVANRWESVRDAVLRSHPWNCATKRVVLAPDVGAPEFDWKYKFSKPGDWLRTLSVGERGEEVAFKDESGKILADVAVLRLRYIWRNDVPASWDAMLAEAMTKAMAAAIAYPITQSAALAEGKAKEFAQFMRQVRAVDGQDEPAETFGDYRLLSARTGGCDLSRTP